MKKHYAYRKKFTSKDGVFYESYHLDFKLRYIFVSWLSVLSTIKGVKIKKDERISQILSQRLGTKDLSLCPRLTRFNPVISPLPIWLQVF